MKSYRGEALRFKNKNRIGRLTKKRKNIFQRRKYILVGEKFKISDYGYAGYIASDISISSKLHNIIKLKPFKDFIFSENDIISIDDSGAVNFVWECNDRNNGFLVTEACNSNCIMCPQPPKAHQESLIKHNYQIIKLIDDNYSGDICFTGGEPTILNNDFLNLVKCTNKKLPSSHISILTNAKRFKNIELARNLALLGIKKLLVCVSFHADVDTIHDKIVGSNGSFRKTQIGLYNLAKFHLPVEIRVVVSKINYTRLEQIAEYIYRNFPFVCHVTFMALEMTGFAKDNYSEVWVDPYDYRDILDKAIHKLHQRKINVSVYNHQLCVLDQKTRPFARRSISAWKNAYMPICEKCNEIKNCCGFFTTSQEIISKNILPISYRLN